MTAQELAILRTAYLQKTNAGARRPNAETVLRLCDAAKRQQDIIAALMRPWWKRPGRAEIARELERV